MLATTHSYDSLGRLVSTIADYEPTTEYTYDALGVRSASVRRADGQWRKTETFSSFVLDNALVWLTQTNIVSCSDPAIAPLVTSSARQLTGLTPALPVRSRSTDIRGNVTESETQVDSSIITSRQTLPYATNKPLSVSRYGVSLMDVSVSAVTNTVAYDSIGRRVANTNGRGNTTRTEYNAFGLQSASIDALGNRTTYVYDQFGNLASVINPLGHAIIHEYDLRGRKTYEGGATYPVRHTYDVFGNKTTMMTYRNQSLGPNSGDVTTWLYDDATGMMTNKVYADGKGPTYSYTPKGKLSRRTWARGIVTDYSYDTWGSLTNTVYSDGTPAVSLAYDALGRQTEAHDAAGVTTFAYDDFGSITNETVIGVAGTNTIIRHWDSFGRSLGYSWVGRAAPCPPQRQSAIAYDPVTGRLSTTLAAGSDTPFAWNYVDGSDLKSSLAYPNGLTASWQYDANNQLIQVCNATATNVISQYDYTYDAAGRRVSCGKSGSAFAQNDTIAYAYNNRRELTNAVAAIDAEYRYAYDFDEIGNRETSSERGTNSVYTANNLNQYTSISNFATSASFAAESIPQFDDDGNQTLVKTATGILEVQYNGENRPVRWTHGNAVITMSYDRMGRRVTKNNQRFVYDGYLQIADNNGDAYAWDPTEPVATRPLAWLRGNSVAYYTHDGDKNVSEVIARNGDVAAHYVYAPFGSAIAQCGASAASNPWRFSSEFAEDDTATVYYNFRHYEPLTGRWLVCDPVYSMHYLIWRVVVFRSTRCSENLYSYVGNALNAHYDKLGLARFSPLGHNIFQSAVHAASPSAGLIMDALYAKMCCRDNEGRRSVVRYYRFGGTPCCSKGESEVPMIQCTCRSCGQSQYGRALAAGGCVGDATNGGYGDAFRHCYGSCKISQICGNVCSFVLGWGNEIRASDEWVADSPMDIHNNAKGREVASSGRDCAMGCLDLLYDGGLRVINTSGHPDSREHAEACMLRSGY